MSKYGLSEGEVKTLIKGPQVEIPHLYQYRVLVKEVVPFQLTSAGIQKCLIHINAEIVSGLEIANEMDTAP
jgi:hypothetical protein